MSREPHLSEDPCPIRLVGGARAPRENVAPPARTPLARPIVGRGALP